MSLHYKSISHFSLSRQQQQIVHRRINVENKHIFTAKLRRRMGVSECVWQSIWWVSSTTNEEEKDTATATTTTNHKYVVDSR